MRALRYAFDEATASLQRGYKTVLLSTATIATAFLVLGGFLVLTSNMEREFARWQGAAELSIYLTDVATPQQRAIVEKAVRDSGLSAAIDLVSKQEAMNRFKETFGEIAESAADLPANPLPESIEVRLRPGAGPTQVDALAAAVAAMPGVADVRYDRRWIERLVRVVGIIRTVGLVLAAVLVFAAALTVASVVRLALVARRDEIHIMQLVGSPIPFIKGPFVMEGLIQGGIGALIAVIALWVVFVVVRGRSGEWFGGAVDPGSLAFLSLPMALGLLVAGLAVGSLGGLIAARSTREIHD